MQYLSLERLVARPNLPVEERLLVLVKASIWPGNWQDLEACLREARNRDLPRKPFEETLLQAVLFYGFPRVVTAFETLCQAWPAKSAPAGGSRMDPDANRAAGLSLFNAIYGGNSASVHSMLEHYHGELHNFVIEAAYGRILSRPGLSPRIRELLACATLARMEQLPQFIAHARGAMHFGAGREQVREALVSALRSEEGVDALLRKAFPNSNPD